MKSKTDLVKLAAEQLGIPPATGEHDELPLDSVPTAMLFAELIERAIESNGLEMVPKQERINLAALLLDSTEN